MEFILTTITTSLNCLQIGQDLSNNFALNFNEHYKNIYKDIFMEILLIQGYLKTLEQIGWSHSPSAA